MASNSAAPSSCIIFLGVLICSTLVLAITGAAPRRLERDDTGGKPYVGNRHPTFYDVKEIHSGQICRRKFELGRRMRIGFKTDVVNDHFDRTTDKVISNIDVVDEDNFAIRNVSFVLDDRDRHLSRSLLPEPA